MRAIVLVTSLLTSPIYDWVRTEVRTKSAAVAGGEIFMWKLSYDLFQNITVRRLVLKTDINSNERK